MSRKLLLFSHSCFSDENANGITMKNLLAAWPPEEKAEFYCDARYPDFSAAHAYFRVTDMQAIRSFFGKKSRHCFRGPESPGEAGQKPASPGKAGIPGWLKKHKYNFLLRWLREYAWILGPWGKQEFRQWLTEVAPDVLVYMVGESIFLDRLVLRVCQETGKMLVLYNSEAYRLIDLSQRRGLERAYYRCLQNQYRRLAERASLVVYNSDLLKADYEERYPATAAGMTVYNSARCLEDAYVPHEKAVITCFGNLGVGRSDVLVRVAEILGRIDPDQKIFVYGNATKEQLDRFRGCPNLSFEGFVSAPELRKVIAGSDILLHVESFDTETQAKLKYAFSTKIAQCLCSGRCFVSFAPEGLASSRYLRQAEGVVVASDEQALETALRELTGSPARRKARAELAYQTGLKNHQVQTNARRLREKIEAMLNETELA